MAIRVDNGALVVFCGCGRQKGSKGNGDGKCVNRIDEKELHPDRDGCLWGNNHDSPMPSLCVQFLVTVARCQRRFPFAVSSQLRSTMIEQMR